MRMFVDSAAFQGLVPSNVHKLHQATFVVLPSFLNIRIEIMYNV